MRRTGRFCALLLAVCLLACLAPASAAGDVYFIAANEKLYPLNDETMPFWYGGTLYVPHTALEENDLGLHYNRNREKQTVLLYKGRGAGLIFDLAAGTAETRDGQVFDVPVVTRGSITFLPLDLVCKTFGFSYSYSRVGYGYLIRLKNESVTLTDAQFIDAASSAMAQRYAQYSRPRTEPDTTGTPAPADDGEAPAEPEAERIVYLVIEARDPSETARVLEHLSAEHAAFLFSLQDLDGADELLRRLAASGFPLALRVDAPSAGDALRQIDEGNRALWAAAGVKTRLVFAAGAGEETERAIRDAGYCPLHFRPDFSDGSVAPGRMSGQIISAADANGGSCCVLLGTAAAVADHLSSLLASLRVGNCIPARLSETNA